MLDLFQEGVSRFLSVIDGNPEYDTLLSHHLSEDMQTEFSDEVPLATRRDRAIASGRERLARKPKERLVPSFEGFACYGQTRNNIQEFKFFDAVCAPIGVSVMGANYAFAEQRPGWTPTRAQIEAGAQIEREVERFYRGRARITPGLMRQFNLYCTAFHAYLVAFTSAGAVWPKGFVVANDHSPVHVAVATVLKGLGVPRIYLQHAEVSGAFPPLDFEHSVLRNERSLEIYEGIGDVRGATYVIPRLAELPEIDALATPLDEPVRVVIYPTARILKSETRSVVLKLLANPLVREVAVKEHPNAAARVADCVDDDRLRFLKAVPSDPHVAIVGNSSIAVELISRGIQVYQNFDFDPIAADYYGFVGAGLAPEVTTDALAERFWAPYDVNEAWRRGFSRWMPTAASGDADRASFLQAMESLNQSAPAHRGDVTRSQAARPRLLAGLARVPPASQAGLRRTWRYLSGAHRDELAQKKKRATAAKQSKQVEFVAYTLASTRDPLAWLAHNQKLDMFEPLVVMGAVERLVEERDVSVSAILGGGSGLNPASLTYAWLELTRSRRSLLPVSAERLGEILERLETVRSARLRRAMERALLPALIDYGTGEQLVQFLDGKTTEWRDFSLSNRTSVLRRLADIPGETERMRALRDEMLAAASAFERLKIANIEFFAGDPPEGWNHGHAERRFAEVAPEPVRAQYAAEVEPVFRTLRPRMTLMDVRADPAQEAAFSSRLRAALAARDGFSCIRLSDGEGFLFPEAGYFGHEDALNRERHWWGMELSGAQRAAIRKEARQTVREADIIGLPSVFRFIRDTSDASLSLSRSVQGRGLLSCLHGVGDLARPDAVFSEDKFNVGLFDSLDAVLDLAAAAAKVVVVSSIRPECLPQRLLALPRLDHVSLPTHNSTRSNEIYVQSDVPLPATYPDLLKTLERKVEPGTLAIVAGGIIGKIFVGRARAGGAVALDVGSVVDDWVTPKLTTLR